ncbi:MAG TPA: class I lanthipeptide [Flavobacterium sp.]|jgi:hypothetical protein|nr:class I lanthipeptide [Flavobacterium sp.]
MKKQNVNNQLAFNKASVAELNGNAMLKVQGGTNSNVLTQVISHMTPAIVTSGLIGNENNAN